MSEDPTVFHRLYIETTYSVPGIQPWMKCSKKHLWDRQILPKHSLGFRGMEKMLTALTSLAFADPLCGRKITGLRHGVTMPAQDALMWPWASQFRSNFPKNLSVNLLDYSHWEKQAYCAAPCHLWNSVSNASFGP